MNDDRCYHVPTSEGQSVCTCLDKRMWLEFVIQVQAEMIAKLLKERHDSSPVLINLECP